MTRAAPLILDRPARVLVQGITGREASFWTERMKEYGVDVVAGVTPGKAGRSVGGTPVYDSVQPASQAHAIDISVLFVPPAAVKTAALEALRAGVPQIVALVEHVPVQDILEVLAESEDLGASIVGPNSPGLVAPGRYFVGILPAWESTIFQPGSIGVVSRSGSLGTLVCLNLVRAGMGQSAFIGIGGDPMIGTTFLDALEFFERDSRTQAVALLGEVGGAMEEEAAPFIARMTKPVVALIAGRTAPEDQRMGHAGAIVSGTRGGTRAKIDALRSAGARIADVPSQISEILVNLFRISDG